MVTPAGVVEVILVPETVLNRPRMSLFRSDSKKRDTKKGRMDRTSIMFSVSVRNSHFLGAPAKLEKFKHNVCYTFLTYRRKYSSVNQAMQMVSIILSQGFSTIDPSAA